MWWVFTYRQCYCRWYFFLKFNFWLSITNRKIYKLFFVLCFVSSLNSLLLFFSPYIFPVCVHFLSFLTLLHSPRTSSKTLNKWWAQMLLLHYKSWVETIPSFIPMYAINSVVFVDSFYQIRASLVVQIVMNPPVM